jgi:hypothetical protein
MCSKTTDISTYLKQFDDRLPNLNNIRNVFEHIDEYRLGKGHNKNVRANELQTLVLDHDRIAWLSYEINLTEALQASKDLFNAIRDNPPNAYLKRCINLS